MAALCEADCWHGASAWGPEGPDSSNVSRVRDRISESRGDPGCPPPAPFHTAAQLDGCLRWPAHEGPATSSRFIYDDRPGLLRRARGPRHARARRLRRRRLIERRQGARGVPGCRPDAGRAAVGNESSRVSWRSRGSLRSTPGDGSEPYYARSAPGRGTGVTSSRSKPGSDGRRHRRPGDARSHRTSPITRTLADSIWTSGSPRCRRGWRRVDALYVRDRFGDKVTGARLSRRDRAGRS